MVIVWPGIQSSIWRNYDGKAMEEVVLPYNNGAGVHRCFSSMVVRKLDKQIL